MHYPKEIYSPRIDVTRRNMQEYDRRMNAIYNKCLDIEPDYYHMTLRERMTIRQQAADLLGYSL